MSNFGKQIIFKQLLDRHGRVEVPMIQRDYAQGREAVAEVRDEFLDALHGALALPIGDSRLPLNLDFIYGSVEGKAPSRFLPLDGQQRLTTLFLLHWYTAWRDGCSVDFRDLLCPEGTSRFSYSVRPSSTEFFDALVKFVPVSSPDQVAKLSSLVKNQHWYFRHWRLDPTVQSALRMLDSIHSKFSDSIGAYARLTSEEHPAITFQLLDLANFGLSDDLYIKMNARGKPLTPFETFKARFEQELESLFNEESRLIGDDEVSVADFFSRRMDTVWADFFWAHRNLETNLYDEAVMNLFRVMILVTRDPENESYLTDIADLNDFSLKSSFTLFQGKKWIDRKFSEALILLLETWGGNGAEFSTQLPEKTFFDEIAIFEKAASRPVELQYSEIVQFVAYITFLSTHEADISPNSFQEWMRVVYNLTTNTSYNRAADLQRSVSGIIGMGPHSGDILTYLAQTEKPTTGFSPQQIQEEKLKAELILAHKDWRALIDRAESHAYFKGQIEFLLDFCGVLEKWKNCSDADWTSKEHHNLQEKFERYLSLGEKMFNSGGIVRQKNYRWERALLSIGDYLLPCGRQNVSFLVNTVWEQGSWKRLLRGSGPKVPESRKLLMQLWDRLSASEEIGGQLEAIIKSASGLELWRQCLIDNPHAIEYCGNRAIRWNSENEVYLLSKTQMNGSHAELFTYCLHRKLQSDKKIEELEPLSLQTYFYSTETGIEPGIRFHWAGDTKRYFELEWLQGSFKIWRIFDSVEGGQPPKYFTYLVENAGFKISGNQIFQTCAHGKVIELIEKLISALRAFDQTEV